MNQLKEIIKKLHSTKPQWSIDIFNSQYENKIKSKYELNDILQESESVEKWFNELGVDKIQVQTFKKNGTGWTRSGISTNIDFSNQQKQTEPTKTNYGLNSYKGLSAPELIANTTLLEKLQIDYQNLTNKYEDDVEFYKTKAKKFEKKAEKFKNKLFLSKLKEANTPFFDNDTKKELASGLTGLLGGFIGVGDNTGLNAPQENLSELQITFIAFIKNISDSEIDKLSNLYNNQYDQGESLENNEETINKPTKDE